MLGKGHGGLHNASTRKKEESERLRGEGDLHIALLWPCSKRYR